MTEPTVLPPNGTRTKLVITVAFLAVMFLLGTQSFEPRQSSRVFAGIAAVTSIAAGIVPVVASHRPQLARWTLLGSLGAVAFMFGFVARLIFRAAHGG